MDSHSIPYTHLPHTSRLFADYLYDYGRVSEFYSYHPFEAESFRKAAQSIHYPADLRRQVVAVLKEQNQQFSSAEKVFDSLRKLERPDCYAVVTGQQMGLFSGPAFAVYKALTAVKLARSLSSKGLEAVPIFWLATEDHDLDEVNHCFVQDREGNPRRLDHLDPPPVPGARVGEVPFTDAVVRLQDELREILPDSAEASGLFELLAECYRSGESYGTAFGRFMARLFRDFGVVLMDPMDRRLHELSARVFRAAIESAPELQRGLAERNRRLIEAGYHVQVRVTENSSLLFLHANGRRSALKLQGEKFVSAQGHTCSV
ncbi:MAG: bacillithiol biosynthesis BshC, partial [Acidobacteriota bacterium]